MTFQLPYRGRFAPSPTGPLHFGSLVAATGSYLQAKLHNGEWLVRIDDIDPPREQKGAATDILKTLESFGFEWDSEVLYQSTRSKRYHEAVDELLNQNLAYHCNCSRASIIKNSGQISNKIIYPGYCRDKSLNQSAETSIRLRSNNDTIHFHDLIQGEQNFNIESDIGDFIIQRRDHLYSYHLASGIDDAEQGITEVIRGADLLECTPSHMFVQRNLKLSTPQYHHLPIAVDRTGQKLSKQTYAEPINAKNAVVLLYKTLKFLGQKPSKGLMDANQNDIWLWAKKNWQLDLIPKKTHITIDWN